MTWPRRRGNCKPRLERCMCPHSADDMTDTQGAEGPQAALDASAPLPTTSPQLSPAVILIADDDPIVRMLMRDALEDEGYSVIDTEDGVAACRCCDEATPSLV